VTAAVSAAGWPSQMTYPPALFSNSNGDVQVSCDGAAARGLHFVAADIGTSLWRSGLVLIFIAVFMGMSNWSALVGK